MNKDTNKNSKGQEGVFISFELMNKYPDMDIITASLYGQIKYWATNKEGYCWAGNDKFAKLLRVSDRQIKRMISYLIDKELITRTLVGNNRKLFIVEMNQFTYTDEVGGHTVPGGGHTVPGEGHTVPGGGHTVPGGGHTVLVIESINKLESKIENKLESNNINYNMQNLDLIEELDGEVKSVVSNTSTNPVGEYIIPGNDDGIDIDDLIKPEIQLTIEEKLEKEKIKSSIKEEELDFFERNIEDKFTKEELNAFDYE